MVTYNVWVAKLTEDAKLPTRKYEDDAGFDIYSSVNIQIPPHSVEIVNTGIRFGFLSSARMRVVPRGRQDFLIGAGLIESNYQGELLVKIANVTGETLDIRKGDSVGQVIFEANPLVELLEVQKENMHSYVDITARGATGGIVTQLEKQESN